MKDMWSEEQTSARSRSASRRWGGRRLWPGLLLAAAALQPVSAHASLFHGETLDKISNVLAWVVLVVAPVVGIGVFWMVHILPEKIAEKRKHPQAKAIQCLCLLSLVFGGLLWPIAWLWAFSKPVLYKMAYGTDIDESHGHDTKAVEENKEAEELGRLRQRLAELEGKLGNSSTGQGGGL